MRVNFHLFFVKFVFFFQDLGFDTFRFSLEERGLVIENRVRFFRFLFILELKAIPFKEIIVLVQVVVVQVVDDVESACNRHALGV